LIDIIANAPAKVNALLAIEIFVQHYNFSRESLAALRSFQEGTTTILISKALIFQSFSY
jgi:hypothetical protein